MKNLIIIVLIFFLQTAYGQKCNCDSDPNLIEIITCDTIHFKNHSKLYRSFTCDSSWLTFENKQGKKKVIYSLEYPLVELTERLGYQYASEYYSTFLIQNNVISGCCDPPEFILFDKSNGNLKVNIGKIIFYSKIKAYPYIVKLTNSNYKNFRYKNYNSLTFLNVNNAKAFKVKLPKGRILQTLKISNEAFPEHLFDEAKIKNGVFIVTYQYKNAGQNEKWFKGKITVNLNRHGS